MLYFHAKIKVFTLYFVLLKMRKYELVKTAQSKMVSDISDDSIFSNFNLHRTNASVAHTINKLDNKFFFLCNKFSAARQKLFSYFPVAVFGPCLLLHKGCTMKKDNFVSKHTWISPSFPCAVAVKGDSNSYLIFGYSRPY